MYREADFLIAYSQKSEEFLLDHGVNKEKIITGEQVMPETCLQPPDPQSKYDSENPVFLSLGYLNKRKGIDVLIDAWTSFENEGAELLIAGSGPERTRLKDRTDDSITWLGYVDPKQKATLYDAADVFVFPTRHDPWGLVVNEAISYGTPVITTTAAGAAQLVRQHGCGCTIPPDDTPALVSAFERLKEVEQRRKMIPDAQARQAVTDVEKGIEPFRKALDTI
jgi:glycosyltransferase involved in cell wall biosynthesis